MITPVELHLKIVELLGEYDMIRNYREGSSRTGVWKIKSKSDSKTYFVKSYMRKTRWHPEVFAYKHWIPSVLPYAPELIDVLEGENFQAIIITSLGGITLREATHLSEIQIERAYYKAGELTRVLHSKFEGTYFGRPDCNGNPIEIFHHHDPVYYMHHSILEAFNRGKELGCLNNKETKLAEWAIENADLFQNSVPLAVSWDSSPNNWVVSEENGEFLGMIDFENMMWGFDVDNFTMMFERYFPNFPKGKDAFFEGYGTDVLKNKALHIKLACIKAGLSGIVWGISFKDERTVLLARKMLASIHLS